MLPEKKKCDTINKMLLYIFRNECPLPWRNDPILIIVTFPLCVATPTEMTVWETEKLFHLGWEIGWERSQTVWEEDRKDKL